jgi:hypothetical protein
MQPKFTRVEGVGIVMQSSEITSEFLVMQPEFKLL